MLKMRREWRRTSSSQAEPSPWRHCWTSWASCSNVSSASNPGTVTCATTSGQFFVNRRRPCSACHTMERKVPPKCSLRHLTPWPESNGRILLTGRRKHKKCRKTGERPIPFRRDPGPLAGGAHDSDGLKHSHPPGRSFFMPGHRPKGALLGSQWCAVHSVRDNYL